MGKRAVIGVNHDIVETGFFCPTCSGGVIVDQLINIGSRKLTRFNLRIGKTREGCSRNRLIFSIVPRIGDGACMEKLNSGESSTLFNGISQVCQPTFDLIAINGKLTDKPPPIKPYIGGHNTDGRRTTLGFSVVIVDSPLIYRTVRIGMSFNIWGLKDSVLEI
ncbi:hypothetical protein EDC39_10638 [Geothermobacter ehrlichii]|uniref:Uncharacterized protein n=1 Tax=Geothermobacter ehrlichii TaxID=213224 RepID=A0A5D3WLM8_9BACT|nr:hypothetical protein EDC39_10638 [Geothermobacter ehrlichii]